MRGNLHDHMGYPVLFHFPEKTLQVGRFGGCHLSRPAIPSPAIAESADDSHLGADLLQDALDEKGGGRLAIGSGYADELKITGRVLVEAAGQPCQRGAGVRYAYAAHRQGTVERLFRDNRPGSPLNGVLDKGTPIQMGSAQCNEDVARLDPTTVIGQPGYRNLEVSTTLVDSQTLEQGCQYPCHR